MEKSSIIHFTWNHIGVAAQLCQDLSVAWSPHQLSLSPPPFKMLSGRSDVEDDVENWKKKFFLGKKYIFAAMIRADANKGVTNCGGISGHLCSSSQIINCLRHPFHKRPYEPDWEDGEVFFFSEEFMPISQLNDPLWKIAWSLKTAM